MASRFLRLHKVMRTDKIVGYTINYCSGRDLNSLRKKQTEKMFSDEMKVRIWRTCDTEFQFYFVLSDLWESYKERSAYVVGMPLVLNDRDGVVQYCVPYLSGGQLYVNRSKSTAKLRWVEFTNKKVAKRMAGVVNGERFGRKKRSFIYHDLWNIKYLSKFKWDDLVEEMAIKSVSREIKLALEFSAAK